MDGVRMINLISSRNCRYCLVVRFVVSSLEILSPLSFRRSRLGNPSTTMVEGVESSRGTNASNQSAHSSKVKIFNTNAKTEDARNASQEVRKYEYDNTATNWSVVLVISWWNPGQTGIVFRLGGRRLFVWWSAVQPTTPVNKVPLGLLHNSTRYVIMLNSGLASIIATVYKSRESISRCDTSSEISKIELLRAQCSPVSWNLCSIVIAAGIWGIPPNPETAFIRAIAPPRNCR